MKRIITTAALTIFSVAHLVSALYMGKGADNVLLWAVAAALCANELRASLAYMIKTIKQTNDDQRKS